MPIISHFYGILIRMYFNDSDIHHTPHIHTQYAEYKAVYDFDGNCITGTMPNKQEKLIIAWIAIHNEELTALWNLTQEENKFFQIEPLK